MMKKYKLIIELKSDLCNGSGESYGNSIDNDICVDDNGFPYIPGRRIKGLLRESYKDICKYLNLKEDDSLFGSRLGLNGLIEFSDAKLSDIDDLVKQLNAFNNLRIEHKANIKNLYVTTRGQTSIDENGIAKKNTLRFTNVVNQHNFNAEASNIKFVSYISFNKDEVDNNNIEILKKSVKALRHIGTNRNRGLGNICAHIEDDENEIETYDEFNIQKYEDDDRCVIDYKIILENPISLNGIEDDIISIPSRAVIGSVASAYIKSKGVDDKFNDLFLNGEVKWSSINPCSKDKRSHPTPLMFTYLVNENKYCNNYEKDNKGAKQKTLEGSMTADDDIVKLKTNCSYHFNHGDENIDHTLYEQDSISSNQIFAGKITCKGKDVGNLIDCLLKTKFSFGRSKTAQYSKCKLYGKPSVSIEKQENVKLSNEDYMFVLLKSDLLITTENNLLVTDYKIAKDIICNEIGGNIISPDVTKYHDYCSFHNIGGYHNMWHMQKQQIISIIGGSVFVFKLKDNVEIRKHQYIGRNQQEGFGEIEILTEKEIVPMELTKSVLCDTKENKEEQSNGYLYDSLVINHIISTLNSSVFNKCKDDGNHLEHAQISRLRTMLDEAKDIKDLNNRVDTIKMDKSKVKIKEFISSIFVMLVEDNDQDQEIKFEFDKKLFGDDNLYNQYKKYQKRINDEWKKILDFVIHQMYYQKRS